MQAKTNHGYIDLREREVLTYGDLAKWHDIIERALEALHSRGIWAGPDHAKLTQEFELVRIAVRNARIRAEWQLSVTMSVPRTDTA